MKDLIRQINSNSMLGTFYPVNGREKLPILVESRVFTYLDPELHKDSVEYSMVLQGEKFIAHYDLQNLFQNQPIGGRFEFKHNIFVIYNGELKVANLHEHYEIKENRLPSNKNVENYVEIKFELYIDGNQITTHIDDGENSFETLIDLRVEFNHAHDEQLDIGTCIDCIYARDIYSTRDGLTCFRDHPDLQYDPNAKKTKFELEREVRYNGDKFVSMLHSCPSWDGGRGVKLKDIM